MELRAGYKNTEVGVIPDDWEVKTIKGITTDMLQGVNTAIDIPEYVESGYPMLKANNIIDGEVNFSTSDHISEKTYQGYSDRFRIKKDDFLFSNIGARLGTGSLMKTSTECSFAWNVMRIIPNQKIVKPEFLGCIMNSPALYKEIKKNESGSGMGFVPKNVLQNLTFSIPKKLEEQTAIATALSDADALISGLEKLIAKKRNIKQGAMQKLLQPKEGDALSLSKGWEVKKLGQICLILNNLRIPIKESSRIKGETPYYGANGIQGYIEGFTHNGEYVLVAEDGANDLNNYPINYTRGKIWVNNHAHVLQGLNSILSTKFLSFILKSIDFQDVLVGGTRAKLNKSILEKIEIPFPTLIEQTRIATILSDMDAEISALEAKLEKYRKVKLGMMQNLLTGKIRLV